MKKEREKPLTRVAVGRTAASALAIVILEEQIGKTGELEIPGLGIKLGPDDLHDDLREAFRKRKAEQSEPHPPKE